ncbi:MAG: hypothetical protein J6V44_08415 [Methanobrevibacter sp.]|nr:hypothetical protein [Methanobrevibacter sp.]
MEKITKREMFEAIIALATDGEMKYEAEAFVNFCENEIALLDKKAAKAKERAATKKAEGDELTEAVRAAMSTEEFEPIADIAARIEGEDVTVAKVQYRLTQLVKNGEAEKEQITVSGGEGQKSRKIMAYKLIG